MSKHIVDELLESGAYRVTRYLSPKLVIRATRVGGKNKLPREIYVSVKIGAPNYLESRIVKACVKAGMVFPLASDYHTFPKKKRAKKGLKK